MKLIGCKSIYNRKLKKNKDEREQKEYLRLINDNEQKKLNLHDEERGSYIKETQECVYELLNNNVTTSRASPVITAVLNFLGFKSISIQVLPLSIT